MVAIATFQELGFFHESLFIDYVDTEWCLRARAQNLRFFIIKQAVMHHQIGECSRIFGIYQIPHYVVIRHFYRLRNSLWLRHFSHVPKLLALREISKKYYLAIAINSEKL